MSALLPQSSFEIVITQTAVKSRRRDAQYLSSLAAMPSDLFQRRDDLLLLYVPQRSCISRGANFAWRSRFWKCRRRHRGVRHRSIQARDFRRQLIGSDHAFVRQQHRALQTIAQLADIARPLI